MRLWTATARCAICHQTIDRWTDGKMVAAGLSLKPLGAGYWVHLPRTHGAPRTRKAVGHNARPTPLTFEVRAIIKPPLMKTGSTP